MPTITDRIAIEEYLRDPQHDLTGYKVIAIDDPAGTLTDNQDEVDDSHMVAHVGPPIIGKEVVIETDVVVEIDTDQREVRVDRIADWVKSSPKLKDFHDEAAPS